ncbi:MAG: biotin--[acetyl-CoA-carboxylase] ligase [Planctomycetales bacterium 4572_13]|nr:MAG: biotin--[acetyl-CoA-carboxylase] ligase [Planctomycetales bacterium 4572_13]
MMEIGDCPYLKLDVDRIEAARKDGCIGRKVILYKSTASTNDIAWEYAANADNHGLCVLAESQSAGRGRRGRVWYSAPGQSVLCSLLLTGTDAPAEMLTLTAGVAVAEAINELAYHHGQAQLDRATRSQCRIKWPNDILIQGQKVAGILVEKRTIKAKPCFVVGIGINCNQTAAAFDGYDLNIPATSLAIQAGHAIDRTELVCILLDKLEYWLGQISVGLAHPTDNPIIQRWLQLSGMLGRHIAVECDGKRHSGFCRGVDPAGGLILQLDNSVVRLFAAAQTTIIDD